MKVLVTGKVSVYPPTGQYQIYVEEIFKLFQKVKKNIKGRRVRDDTCN